MTRQRRPEIVHAIACTVALIAVLFAAGSALAQGVQSVQEIRNYGITFVRPSGWESVPSQFSNVTELRRDLPQALGPGGIPTEARLLITVDLGRSRPEVVNRLQEIALESEAETTFLDIGGWPALQRRQEVPVEKRNSLPGTPWATTYWRVTTAVAAGNKLLRMEAIVSEGLPEQLNEAEEIGRSSLFPTRGTPSWVDRVIEQLRNELAAHRTRTSESAPEEEQDQNDAASASPEGMISQLEGEESEVIVRANNSAGFPDSEIEVAISNDGRQIVLGVNADEFMFSNNFGASFTTGTIPTPGLANGGDPSFAFGQSGNFYHAFIGFPDTDGTAPTQDECATTVNRSSVDPNGVMSWTFRGNAMLCNDNGGPLCFPDQEHIAADPRNAAPAPGGDQVYSVWRHFTGGTCNVPTAGPVASIVCSTDGGATWTANVAIDAAGDRPRLSVGADGSVHVVYVAGASIMYQRYSSCASGLAPAGLVRTVRTGMPGSASTCPVPGIDRCSAPFVSSHTVAADNVDPNHVYVAYAFTTVANRNEDIIVQDSRDRGVTWPAARRVRISRASPPQSRKFMPWICTSREDAYVGWYDRRNATPADNSLTDYFIGTARFNPVSGDLTAGVELAISTASDSQCGSGFVTDGGGNALGCIPRSPNDASDCTGRCCTAALVGGACPAGSGTGANCDPANPCTTAGEVCRQAQMGGLCCTTALNGGCPAGSGSGTPCEFAVGCTVAGEVCQAANGCPKYGDYSGIACAASHVVASWASATSPAGMVPASTNIDTFADVLSKDLRVEELALSSASVAAGQQVTVSYKTFNRARMSITEDWREAVSLRDPNVADPNVVVAALGTSHLHTVRLNLGVSHATSQAFTIPAATAPGSYVIRVRGDSTNSITESIETNDVTIPITITLGKDLDVQALTVTPATSSPGQQVTVAYEVLNAGGVLVTEDWKESIHLRDPNGVLTALGSSHLHTDNLAPAGVHPYSRKVTIPAGAATGAFSIVVKTDSLAAIAEGNETNNEETTALTLQAGTKDIVIQNLAVSPNPVSSGGNLLVNYRIVNQGTIMMPENFKENIFLKAPAGTETQLGSSHLHTENLAPAAGHDASKSFTIPAGLAAGTYMIIVRGDAGSAVAESNETNNEATINVTIQ